MRLLKNNQLVFIAIALAFFPFSSTAYGQAPSSLNPTVVITTDAQTPATTGASNVNSDDSPADSDFYVRERRDTGQVDRRISTFLNFDVSSLGNADINQPGFSVALTADYDFRLNDLNSASVVVGRVTNGAWNGTSTMPLHGWGIDDSADRATIITNVAGAAPPSTVSADVTDIVKDWVDGTHANYGLAVFLNQLEFNGAGFSNPQLIITFPLDTDGDGMPDNYEVSNGLNPNFDDSGLDADSNGGSDGLTNLEEFNLGTDPQDSDSDDDGLSDGDEVNGTLNPWTAGVLTAPPGEPTDPLDPDSDSDFADDQAEILAGTNPNVPDGAGQPVFPFIDTDGDSYRDEAEVAFGTDPNNPKDTPDHRTNLTRPNIVIIYADDLGFTEVSHYGEIYGVNSPAPTPNIDSIAQQGVTFTQGHSGNGVCTPSRYALLTGKYNWREFDGISGRWGAGRGDLPRPSDVTMPEFLKTHQYDTAGFGKWHLGGRFYRTDGTVITDNPDDPSVIDWARPVDFHAVANGFDHFRGLGVAINFPPYVYMIDDRIQFWDTTLNGGQGAYRPAQNTDPFRHWSTAELNAPVRGQTDSRAGLGDPSYSQNDPGPQLFSDVENYIAQRATSGDTDPFFAYVSMHSPHDPWAITPEFIGADTANGFLFADFLREVDHRVGRVLTALEDNGFADNTIVIFTSDNGPENTNVNASLANGRDSNGPLRGIKQDVWDGGTRVPFIVRWPGQAAPGVTMNEVVSQVDIFATIAAFLGSELPDSTCPDGESFLNLIRGQQKPEQRRAIVMSSFRGDLGLKTNDGWKFIDSTGGGGRDPSFDSSDGRDAPRGVNRGFPKQLFHQAIDIGEDNNLINSFTADAQTRAAITDEVGEDLLALMDDLRANNSTSLFPRVPDNDGDGDSNAEELANGGDPNFGEVLLGDADLSGVINFADIPAFIDVLLSGVFQAESDCDCSGVVDFADIPVFIDILLSQ